MKIPAVIIWLLMAVEFVVIFIYAEKRMERKNALEEEANRRRLEEFRLQRERLVK